MSLNEKETEKVDWEKLTLIDFVTVSCKEHGGCLDRCYQFLNGKHEPC